MFILLVDWNPLKVWSQFVCEADSSIQRIPVTCFKKKKWKLLGFMTKQKRLKKMLAILLRSTKDADTTSSAVPKHVFILLKVTY